jgi:response regulator RpfG family c-di-GMP phosphodiesterase
MARAARVDGGIELGTAANAAKILLVDDEENLLSGLKRQLRNDFKVTTAAGGAAALEALDEHGPFAVVVSDMQMPEMNGVEVLEAFKERAQETVRMMLTGNADQETATHAINTGNIFRFFSKPCATEDLVEGLTAGVKQYRLLSAERELLEKTLAGSLKLLSDIMSFLDPNKTRDVSNMRDWARPLTKKLKYPRPWEIDFACMLATLGQISVPPELLAKQNSGEVLSEDELEVFQYVPEVGRDLISNIPRLGGVSDGILYQDENFDGGGFPEGDVVGNTIPPAGRFLKVLKAVAGASRAGSVTPGTIESFAAREGVFDPGILAGMKAVLQEHGDIMGEHADDVDKSLTIGLLRDGQRLLDDLHYADGRLLLSKKTVLTDLHVNRLRALAKTQALEEPVRVMMPTGTKEVADV